MWQMLLMTTCSNIIPHARMPCKRVAHYNSVCNDALCSALVHRILLSSPSLKAIVVDRTAGSTPSEVPSS